MKCPVAKEPHLSKCGCCWHQSKRRSSSACLGTKRALLWLENRQGEVLGWLHSGVEDDAWQDSDPATFGLRAFLPYGYKGQAHMITPGKSRHQEL